MLQENSEQMVEFKPQSKTGQIVGAVLLILALAGYVFFVRPFGLKVDILSKEFDQKNAQLSEIKASLNTLKSSEKKLDITSEVKKQEILSAVPSGLKQDQIIRDLVNIAKDYDIILHSLGFGKGAFVAEGINSLRVNASFEGNYADLTNFLEGIEQNGRLFKVNSISVQIAKANLGEVLRANFSLAIEAFYQK